MASHAVFICQHGPRGTWGNGWGTSAVIAAAEHVNAATLLGIDETARWRSCPCQQAHVVVPSSSPPTIASPSSPCLPPRPALLHHGCTLAASRPSVLDTLVKAPVERPYDTIYIQQDAHLARRLSRTLPHRNESYTQYNQRAESRDCKTR